MVSTSAYPMSMSILLYKVTGVEAIWPFFQKARSKAHPINQGENSLIL